MKRFLTLFLALTMLVSQTTVKSVNASNTSETLEQKAKRLANELLTQTQATSVQYSIIDNGKIVLSDSAGVYDKETNKPVQKNNMYGIGSTSKAYVAASIMSLVDKGLVDIDMPLTNYIKEFKMADERYKKITLRMLMDHSSGIYGTTYNSAFTFNDNPTENHDKLLSKLQTQTLKFEPGQYSEYCNDGFSLLEQVVERVSGVSYSEYLSRQFFKPLGLNTKTPQDNFDRNLIIKNYVPFYDGALPVENANLIGSGGLYSSADDLAKFGSVLMGQYPQILSKKSSLVMSQDKSVKQTIPPGFSGKDSVVGLGFDSVQNYPFNKLNIKAVSKGGDVLFNHSSLLLLPEYNISMAVCSSGASSSFDYIFQSRILQEYLKQKNIIKEIYPEIQPKTPVKEQMPKELQKFDGVYVKPTSQFDIKINDGIVRLPSGGYTPEQNYIYTKEGTFVGEDGITTLKFVEEGENMYLQAQVYYQLPGIGGMLDTSYLFQKANDVKVSETVLNSWASRAGNKYYLVNEKAHSEMYFLPTPLLSFSLNSDFKNGYAFGGAKIIDNNNAINTLDFRDVTDLNFFYENNTEYLNANTLIYINDKFIKNIFAGDKSFISIQSNGYARYAKIGDDVAGKTITVQVPQKAAYVVYDENGIPINFTTVSNNNTTVLPKNGMIAFIGNPRDVFNITLK